jgi:hypothetical protein
MAMSAWTYVAIIFTALAGAVAGYVYLYEINPNVIRQSMSQLINF